MEQRKYIYSLKGDGTNYMLRDSVNLSFSLSDGFPSVSLSLAHNDQISDLVDAYRDGTLINKTFELKADLVGIRSIANLTNLAMTRMSPQETPDGYMASCQLAPKPAAFASTYPAMFVRETYRFTVKGLLEEIVNEFNTMYPSHPIKDVVFEGARDPICLLAPRFLQVPYMDMLKTVAERHGFMALLDLNSKLRVFVPTVATTTAINLSKHNVAEGSLTLDALQVITG